MTKYIHTKRFLKKHWDELVHSGMPLDILEDVDKWTYFIEHGNYPNIPFSIEELDVEFLEKLNKLSE